MNAQTLSAVEYVEEGPMPPYPIYMLEFEDYDEVVLLRYQLRLVLEGTSEEWCPVVRQLAESLKAMTPQVTL